MVLIILCGMGAGIWYLSKWLNTPTVQEINDKNSAKIASYEGDVRVIRASTRETIKVDKQIFLLAGDTIQTQADGRANLTMADGSTLMVRPNSTVVIRDNTSLFSGSGGNVRVTLDDGQINVKTQEQAEGTKNVVELNKTENQLSANTEASFATNPTKSTGEIRISRGTVESNTDGQKTVIQGGEFVAVNPNGKIAQREKLIDAPKPLSPAALEKVLAGANDKARVIVKWQSGGGAASYRVEVATSPFFVPNAMIEQKEPLNETAFVVNDLPVGTYYWRVRLNSTSGQNSEWSEPWKFIVVGKAVGDTAKITAQNWKVESLGGGLYQISGMTNAGITVKIGDRSANSISDGSFQLQVSVPSGTATVELSDDTGNRARYSLSLANSKATKIN